MTSSRHAEHYELRSELREALRGDLLGPFSGPDEILSDDAPVTAYPIGVLFPMIGDSVPITVEEDGADNPPDVVSRSGDESETADLGISLANRRKPSTMGLTFVVDPQVTNAVDATVRAATYVPEDENGLPVEPRRSDARSRGRQDERWRRLPLTFPSVPIDVTDSAPQSAQLHSGLQLRARVRRPASDGTVTVTITLVNTHKTGEFDLQDAYCYFQPSLHVAARGAAPALVERKGAFGAVDDEQALSRLLYRYAPIFAVGHGCSVEWDWSTPAIDQPMPARAAVTAVWTEFIPSQEVLLTDSNPTIDDSALGMHALGTGDVGQVRTALTRLLNGYARWIEERRQDAEAMTDPELAKTAADQITLCGEAHTRMTAAVELLTHPERGEIFEAFRLANRAMALQRSRTVWIANKKAGSPDLESARWRPFQIAFMLLCLRGIVEPGHEDRKIADLLWFPTGGGKTEAYLGLIAFTVFHRRLRDGADGAGVTVLMRYTLRLLTLQQFQRAAVLICAMETIRADRAHELGSTPISIGMWVGQSATPNRLDVAEKSLDALRKQPSKKLARNDPTQLAACPWCGAKLTAHDYEVREQECRMVIRCPNTSCRFSAGAGIPVHVVDDTVYAAHPTLIIATVDKFASMPWRPATAALFNRDLGDAVRAPELIVQDELHLISGPLGTLTGLYETAVDTLAETPKIVASTATIRRASDQITKLFDRGVCQFPPAGLDARDSWFAVETPRESKASRRYVGLLTPSTSQATLLVRVYAVLLDAVARSGSDDAVRDAYWTLVGYFNSLRLLSAAELQVLDDVKDRLELLAKRRNETSARSSIHHKEVSSRAAASDIRDRLEELTTTLADPDPLDVVLATNMMSVGVDIDRLGLMAVMGQPQTRAEYIQATSRVGRRHPGLVAVMLNSARSRDRSHYENFPGFHTALYRDVESTSVTPFSNRARDRGLHAVIIALTRLLIPAARDNEAAARIEDFVADIDRIVRPRVLERVESVDPDELESTERYFDDVVQWWRDKAAANAKLVYEAPSWSRQGALLASFDTTSPVDVAGLPTLWSLRDVDVECGIFHDTTKAGARK
jgi:hypothetical protein